MKKKGILAASAAVILLLLIGMAWWLRTPGYARALKANWGISLPAGASCAQQYEKDTGASFNGDGNRYHVFSYQDEEYIEPMFAWSSQDRATIFYNSLMETAEAWLEEIDVPEEERPEYGNCLHWYDAQEDNSEIIMFWDAELDRLYVLESFL